MNDDDDDSSDSEMDDEQSENELSDDYLDNSSSEESADEEEEEESEEDETSTYCTDTDDDSEADEDTSSLEDDNDTSNDSDIKDNEGMEEDDDQDMEGNSKNVDENGKFMELNSDVTQDQNKFRNNTKNKEAPSKIEKTDEYADHDTSDEEDIRNTVGNVPMRWYDDYKHLGYDWDGKALIKPETRDNIDDFLQRMENPEFWRTVKDPQTGQDVVLTDEDVQLIGRIRAQKIPDVSFDEYAVSKIIFNYDLSLRNESSIFPRPNAKFNDYFIIFSL